MTIPLHLLQKEKERRANKNEIEKCKTNKEYWLTHYAWTLDPHDQDNPIKKFPNKEYIKKFIKIWDEEGLLLVPKSRQMMVTWLCCALSLHEAQFTEGSHIFFQSKKEDDANTLIDRAKFIFDHQPDFLKVQVNKTYCKLVFPESNAKIIGIPQGGDQIRMHTASRFFLDEMAFQPAAEEAMTAAKPCLDGGGKFVGVSSANPGYFSDLVAGEAEELKIMKGMTKKYMQSGFCSLRLHYTADPAKATEKWKTKARRGLDEAKWNKEYEIDFSVFGGMKVYPELDIKNITAEPFDIPKHWKRYAGIDPGVRNPTSIHFYAIDERGAVYVYWELYESGLHYKDIARILHSQKDFELLKNGIYIDPIVVTRTHHTERGIASFKELLEEVGIFTIPGIRSRIDGAERIREYIRDNKLIVFKNCPKMMEELTNLRYEEWTGEKSFGQNKKESIVGRNDHAWSDLRYFLMSNPASARKLVTGIEAKIKKLNLQHKNAFGEFYRI